MSVILTAGIGFILIGLSFAIVSHRLISQRRTSRVEEDWQWLPFQPVSSQGYSPMERLLGRSDFDFLRAHRGFDRQRLRGLRTRRRELFRAYLACLSLDYTRTCAAIKMLMVQSAYDRPDLSSLLLRQRFQFTLGMVGAEFSLALHPLGINTWSIRHLIGALRALEPELNELVVLVTESNSSAPA